MTVIRTLFLALVLFSGGFAVHAQTIPAGLDTLTLEIQPQFPGAFEETTLRVRSTLLDLSRGSMTVTQNGRTIHEGQGAASVSFTTGRSGLPQSLTVRVTIDGVTHTKNLTFTPSDLTLTYEAASYTPALYKGKKLLPADGQARIIALPDFRLENGNPVNNNQIIYTWKVDGRVLFDESGIGKNNITVTVPTKYRSRIVSVTAATRDSSITTERAITLTPDEPVIRAYILDPLVGALYEKAIMQNENLTDETTVIVEPFHFSASSRNDSALAYQWRMNRATIPGETTPRLTLRNTNNTGGTAALDVRIMREGMPFQIAQHFFNLTFTPR